MRYTDAMNDKVKTERKMRILGYLFEHRGGKDTLTIMNAVDCGGRDAIRRCLADMSAEGLVNRTHGNGGRRGKAPDYYHITPSGEERFMAGTTPTNEGVRKDWSVTPSLMDDGDTVSVAHTMPEPTPEPEPETKEVATQKDVLPLDIESLGRTLDMLAVLHSGDDDIDFDIGALASKIEGRIRSSILPCPHCSGTMEVQNVGLNKMMVCKGCDLAVTYKDNPRDLSALVKRWNQRA